MRQVRNLILLPVLCMSSFGQTRVDLSRQSKAVDFSSAGTTKPMKVVGTLPANCAVGEFVFHSSEQLVYSCVGQDNWSPLQGNADLAALNAVRETPTTLRLAKGCSLNLPCNVRFGSMVYTFTAEAVVTLQSGTGVAYIYISNLGELTVGHNVTLSCTGCMAASGVTAFPVNSVPLFLFLANTGIWEANPTDARSVLSGKVVAAGTGLARQETPAQTTLSVDPAVVGLRVAVPGTATETCTPASWAMDATHLYFCVQENTWRRVAIAAW